MTATRPHAGGSAGQDVPLADLPVEVRRSRRRRRTVSAYEDGGRVVVLLPASFSKAQEREWVDRMVARLAARRRRRPPSDDALLARAAELSRRYLDGDCPASVRWVSNQHTRWGSCTPSDRTIRLSDRLADMPAWVVDYVLLHELAHLKIPDHSARFWRLLESYPRTERARGYLEGVAAAAGLNVGGDADEQADKLF
ncbi:M48 family metallopeptidase [Fodinicola acaciae]|uniref:M48 metallopeptidase family protein n=1 Tax=Fodinicola acaciae TaxID=2681555 RepID=UPI001FE5A8D8|nr:M48 family metallopeptidase [Fodinicola acaciae]